MVFSRFVWEPRFQNFVKPRKMDDITLLLEGVRQGDEGARDRLAEAIQGLRNMAANARMVHEPRGHLLQTTALVNEAVVRLLSGKVIDRSPNRRFLFAAASRAMRAILVDHEPAEETVRGPGGDGQSRRAR